MTAGIGTAAFRQLRSASTSVFSHFATSLRQFVLTGLGVIVIVFVCSWLWYQSGPQAPGDTAKPVSSSTIKPGSVSGDACQPGTTVVAAWLENDAGGNLYGVRCSNGVVTEVAQ